MKNINKIRHWLEDAAIDAQDISIDSEKVRYGRD